MTTVRYGLDNTTVLLTGAAGGIGQALAQAFTTQGATLLAVDRDAGGLPHCIGCDLNSDAAVAALAARLANDGVSIDVLINNAGTEHPTPLADEDPAAMQRWSALLDNNVTSMVRLTRALLPLLPRGASVINQSSIWGLSAVADYSAYVASKHAVIGLTRSLAFELAPRGIRVNAVCPGWVRTEAAMRTLHAMAQQRGVAPEVVEREIVARQALPQMLEAAELAGVFLFLASADSAALTGQSIVVSHGEVMN